MGSKSRNQKARREAGRQYSDPSRRENMSHGGFESTAFKIPNGMRLYAYKPGKLLFDLLPYVVGEGNPAADPGTLHYERTYYTHRGIGPNNTSYCCLARNWKKKCPVCEELARLARDPENSEADAKAIKAKMAKERQLMLLKEPKEPVALFDVSYHLFGKKLQATLDLADRGDPCKRFYHLTKGMSLRVVAAKASMGQNSFAEAEVIQFVERQRQYKEEILDKLPCLDDLLIQVPYKELKDIFMSGSVLTEEGDDDDEEPKKKRKGGAASRRRDRDDEDEDEDDDYDSDAEDDEDPDDEDDEDADEDDEDADDDADDDEDDDDEDDEPRRRPKKKSSRKSSKKKRSSRSADDEDDEDDDF